MIADMLTKGLGKGKLQNFRDMISLKIFDGVNDFSFILIMWLSHVQRQNNPLGNHFGQDSLLLYL